MNKKKIYFVLIIISIVLTSGFLIYEKLQKPSEEISYLSFLEYLEEGKIDEVILKNDSKIEVLFHNQSKAITDNPRTENFKEKLLMYNIKVVEKSTETSHIVIFISLVLLLVFLIFYFNSSGSKEAEKEIANISKIDTIHYDQGIRFTDIAGNQEAKESLIEMVDFIKRPEIYNKFGARLPRGVLLYGPPGTGKTLLAKALAGEAGVPIFPVSGSDFIQVYSGLGAGRIRDLFKRAKSQGKSVIFIDEIDSLGKKRKGSSGLGSEEGDRTLNALLSEMSGFKDNEGIIVIAATNRIDVLDEALLRPGRFDRQIEVQLPDVNARERILRLHSENKPISRNVDLKKLALETVYFSGAKLENLLNESAMIAVKSKENKISQEHINQAYYKVLIGDEIKDRSSLRIKDRKITAYHEAGHALIAKLVSSENRVTKVSIIPSTKGMGGFSLNIPPDKMYQTKTEILNNIMIQLGGRAAEEIIYGKENVTTGASSDLEKATETVLSMIGVYGMDSDMGLLNYNIIRSRELASKIDLIDRGREILDLLYKDTIVYLESSLDKLNRLAEDLLEKEVLNEEEINNIFYNSKS